MDGPAGDIINIAGNSWAHAGAFSGLTETDATTNLFAFGTSTLQLITTPHTNPATTSAILLDGIATYANAAALVTGLTTVGVGDVILNGAIANGATDHILVAYSTGPVSGDIRIADVTLVNTSGAGQTDTAHAGVAVSAIDIVDLVGIGGLGQLGHLNPHDFVFS